MIRTALTRCPVSLVAAVSSVLLLTACIVVPHPMTRRIIDMNGAIKGEIDYSFIRAGSTKAGEVRDRLKNLDTGFESDRLFWGRWCDSHSGVTGGVGGYGGAAASTGRLWGARNLFVRFDEQGTVTGVREFKDGELYAVATAWVNEANPAPLDLSNPVRLVVKHHEKVRFNNATIILSAGEFAFTEDNNPAHSFAVKPAQIKSVDAASARDSDHEPRLTAQTIHFSANTAVGSKLTVEMYARDLMDLIIYLRDQRKN
jgi:hypothetical protein